MPEEKSEKKVEAIIIEKKMIKEDEGKEYKDRMILRSYSPMILLIPSFITSLACGIAQLIINHRLGGAIDPNALEGTGYMNIIGIVFFSIFTLNLILIAFEFDRMRSIIIIILLVALVAVIILVNVYTDFLKLIINNFPTLRLYLSTQIYILLTILFLIILLFTWIRSLFNYYIIEGNELVHHKGLGGGSERYPATNMTVVKEFPDIIEYIFFRSGTLILTPPKVERAIVLRNVFFINRKVREMQEILSRLKVDVD